MGEVDSEILKMAASQGLFAVLFVALLFYVLRENAKREEASEKREAKYQDIIAELSNKMGVIEDIREDVREIKNKVYS